MGAAVEKVQFEAPQRAGQATQIEQSRAVAEVQAAVVVAQQIPRVVARSVGEMEESCKQPELAERAFFSFPRGGKSVQGPTVHLARELARCWGNVQYGIAELSRDRQRSEMMAWAWDVQTNTRSSQTFIVPHARDKRDSAPVALTDMRDIHENNANQGARRVREAIFNVLPPWYTAKAEDLCRQTLEHGGGKPLAQRVADAVRMFDDIGVAVADLEGSVGRDQAAWTAQDVSQLGVKFKTIHRGEASIDDLFPRVQQQSQVVSVADIQAQQDTQKGGGADGSVSDGDAAESGDGSGSHDAGRVEPEPSPAAEGDPGTDGAPGSPDIDDPAISDETLDRAKAAAAAAREAGNHHAFTAQLKAEGLPVRHSAWQTEAQGLAVIAIAEGLS